MHRHKKSRQAATSRRAKTRRGAYSLTASSIAERAAAVKDFLTPAEYYSDNVERFQATREHGENKTGLCPFHNDTHPGSFAINMESGAFYCFSCGASGGDIIDFHRQLNGLSFIDAVDELEGIYL
ncbi:MAG: hypothetical protein GX130_05290 [Candidatus Hydrogenedens sp.]|jgi:hypothetical protein|nr:hypothetical protein [Candidatus Hydrogenedens sp.]